MKIRRLAAISTIAAATAVPIAPGPAIADSIGCPDDYQPVPIIVLPPDGKNRDKNSNGIVCVKGPQGSNEHFNSKDDNRPLFVDDVV